MLLLFHLFGRCIPSILHSLTYPKILCAPEKEERKRENDDITWRRSSLSCRGGRNRDIRLKHLVMQDLWKQWILLAHNLVSGWNQLSKLLHWDTENILDPTKSFKLLLHNVSSKYSDGFRHGDCDSSSLYDWSESNWTLLYSPFVQCLFHIQVGPLMAGWLSDHGTFIQGSVSK